MSDKLPPVHYMYDTAAVYQIRVCGKIKPNWSDRLEGMTISSSHTQGGGCVTTLEGELHGQPALFGVLRTLYDERLTVLSVARLTAED